MTGTGFILAAASAVCNGSFAALAKLPQVLKAETEPVLFNFYVCIGVFISGICVLPFLGVADQEVGFTPMGFLAGCLFVLAVLFSFLAIPEVGLAIGQAVWAGAAILVSYLWGAVGPEAIRGDTASIGGSVAAVLFLLVGILGIIYSQRLSEGSGDANGAATEVDPLLSSSPPAGGGLGLEPGTSERPGSVNNGRRRKRRPPSLALGLGYALLVGLFGGSILVPLTYVENDKLDTIGFLPSFGLGCLVFGAITTGGVYAVLEKRMPRLDLGVSLLPGILAGFVWNAGNLASIYAMTEGLSYGVAYPLMQCALFVSGLWGVLVFKEITGTKAVITFFAFGGVLMAGAVLLAVYGPQSTAAASGNSTNKQTNTTTIGFF